MNRKILFVIIFLVSLSTIVFAQTKNMRIAGVTRSYIVHAPSGLNNPPLVFNIHGYNMDAASEQSYTKMDQIADREKFIVVYPDAISKSWDLSDTSHDFTFLLAIIDTVDAKYHIDKARIYSCGFSQGGFMSFQLACRYSDIFAAIAPTSGLISMGGTGTCSLKRPVSMRLTFGTDDVATSAQFMQNVATWLDLCNCPKTSVVTRPYPSSNSNSLVTRLYYGPCDQGTEVIADSVRTGQHEWPMNTSDRINNSEETWAFLKKFTLKSATDIQLKTFPVAQNSISVSYSCGIVRLQGTEENCRVRVFDTRGRCVSIVAVTQRQFDFKNEPSGVYVVKVSGNEKFSELRMVVP
jgi:poly(3-hydroxybutyrate) depolymerase